MKIPARLTVKRGHFVMSIMKTIVTGEKQVAASIEPYTRQDLTRLLGCSLSTVDRLKDAGKIPGMTRLPGRRHVRFRRDVVDKWVANGCK